MSAKSPIIIAVDPGNERSALVVLNDRVITKSHLQNNDAILNHIKTMKADALAIEMVKSYGMPVGDSIFQTCLWTGRFYQAWADTHPTAPIFLIPRKTIVMHVCQSTNAKDANVRASIIDMLGAPGNVREPGPTFGLFKDLWSAAAVAITAHDLYLCPLS